ncbi:MAG: beta-lactamase family protein [Ktedonobacteraceae bacterium]|nr:beta-lactamase family protein [Ktedonobacteraceae bacterium]MBO0792164.1 beta-lactamase family protein [Ktedonobacteraceae bacterium]
MKPYRLTPSPVGSTQSRCSDSLQREPDRQLTGPCKPALTSLAPTGTVSKSFTALATMQLAEQGKLALDTPVQRYLPWFNVGHSFASIHLILAMRCFSC